MKEPQNKGFFYKKRGNQMFLPLFRNCICYKLLLWHFKRRFGILKG
jgi:hypothetical protein